MQLSGNTIIGIIQTKDGKKFYLRYDRLVEDFETKEISNKFTVAGDVYEKVLAGYYEKLKKQKDEELSNIGRKELREKLAREKEEFVNIANERIKEVKESAEKKAREEISSLNLLHEKKIAELEEKSKEELSSLSLKIKEKEEYIEKLISEKEISDAENKEKAEKNLLLAKSEIESLKKEKEEILTEKENIKEESIKQLEEEKIRLFNKAKEREEEERKALELEKEEFLKDCERKLSEEALKHTKEKEELNGKIALLDEETEKLRGELADAKNSLLSVSERLLSSEKEHDTILEEDEKLKEEGKESLNKIRELEEKLASAYEKLSELKGKKEGGDKYGLFNKDDVISVPVFLNKNLVTREELYEELTDRAEKEHKKIQAEMAALESDLEIYTKKEIAVKISEIVSERFESFSEGVRKKLLKERIISVILLIISIGTLFFVVAEKYNLISLFTAFLK